MDNVMPKSRFYLGLLSIFIVYAAIGLCVIAPYTLPVVHVMYVLALPFVLYYGRLLVLWANARATNQ